MRKKYLKGIVAGMMVGAVVLVDGRYANAKSKSNQYEDTYDVYAATEYATKYYQNYNSHFVSMDKDCTNFVSQCVNAGGFTRILDDSSYDNKIHIAIGDYWYNEKKKDKYKVSKTWVNCGSFNRYMGSQRDVRSYSGLSAYQARRVANVGDVVQVVINGNAMHSLIVTKKIVNKDIYEIYMAAHTNDRMNISLAFQDSEWKKGIPDLCVSYNVIKFTEFK